MGDQGFKALTGTRAPKFGSFVVEFASPGIGHILKAAGCEFVLFDLEHSGFSLETVKSVVRYFEAAQLPAIVRVPARDYHFIARALDIGVEALMLPMVGSPDHVREILGAMKYAPAGGRGVALGVAHDRYRAGAVADKLAEANRRTTFVCLIETAEGVENIDEIAAIDGVDVLWVGHFDLSVSLGIPGQFDSPTFRTAMDKVYAACQRHNKSLGRMVTTPDQGVELYRAGCDFICYSGDIWLLQSALSDGISRMKEILGGEKD